MKNANTPTNNEEYLQILCNLYNSNQIQIKTLEDTKKELDKQEKQLKSSIRYQIGDIIYKSIKKRNLRSFAFPLEIAKLIKYNQKNTNTNIDLESKDEKPKATYVITDLNKETWLKNLKHAEDLSNKFQIKIIFYCFHLETFPLVYNQNQRLSTIYLPGTSFPNIFDSIMQGIFNSKDDLILTNELNIVTAIHCFLAKYHFNNSFHFFNCSIKRRNTKFDYAYSTELLHPSSSSWTKYLNRIFEVEKFASGDTIDITKIDSLKQFEISASFAEFLSTFQEKMSYSEGDIS